MTGKEILPIANKRLEQQEVMESLLQIWMTTETLIFIWQMVTIHPVSLMKFG